MTHSNLKFELTLISSVYIFLVFNFKIKKEILHSNDSGEKEKNDGKYCF